MNARQIVDQPRVPLAQLPTPLETANWAWGESRLLVKRDDCTGLGLTGNKVRKLEYLLADAVEQGCDTVVTSGGVQSNHARATAIAARRVGLNCVLVLAGETPDALDGNLLLDRMVGADVRILPPMSQNERTAAAERIADELQASGAHPYLIPSGGSNEIGALAYIRAAEELAADLRQADRPVECIVVPVGSGGTYAGLFLGAKLFGLGARIIGATVDGTPDTWKPDLTDYVSRCIRRWKLDISIDPDDFELIDAVGRGYALSAPVEIEFIVAFARKTGLFLDPVYTGKAMYALDRDIRAGNLPLSGDLLFIHTGGVFGLFPQKGMLADAVGHLDRDAAAVPETEART